jgi:hypothetical protein
MNETKSFASLSPSLLARKGAARPAMRPQLQTVPFERAYSGDYPQGVDNAADEAAEHNDLGWNDIAGEDIAAAPQPEVLRQIETLADAMRAPAETKPEAPAPAQAQAPAPAEPAPQPARRSGSALQEGRKAAFTLRLDGNRHLRLRLACAVENRSAQQFVTEALDLFLETMPGLEDLAQRARQS